MGRRKKLAPCWFSQTVSSRRPLWVLPTIPGAHPYVWLNSGSLSNLPAVQPPAELGKNADTRSPLGNWTKADSVSVTQEYAFTRTGPFPWFWSNQSLRVTAQEKKTVGKSGQKVGQGPQGEGSMRKGRFYRTCFQRLAPLSKKWNSFLKVVCWLCSVVKMEWKMQRMPWRGLGLACFLPPSEAQFQLRETMGKHAGPPRRKSEVWASSSLSSRPCPSLHPATHTARSEVDCQENGGNVLTKQTLDDRHQPVHLLGNEIKYGVRCRMV